jgi:hypothetical protein
LWSAASKRLDLGQGKKEPFVLERVWSHKEIRRRSAMLNMIPQRELTIGIAVLAALVALINLAGAPSLNYWNQFQPTEVAHRLATVRL